MVQADCGGSCLVDLFEAQQSPRSSLRSVLRAVEVGALSVAQPKWYVQRLVGNTLRSKLLAM